MLHQHGQIDISGLNLAGTFYFLIAVLDASSRYLVPCEIRETMTKRDTEVIVQRALEKYPDQKPRIISRPTYGRGPWSPVPRQGFQTVHSPAGLTHVRTTRYYPQSNGKLERWHDGLK